MADEKLKRIERGKEALGTIIEKTMRSVPELAENTDSIKPYLEDVALDATRLALRLKEDPYLEYKDQKNIVKTFVNTATDKAAKEFGISPSIAEKVKLGIGGIAKFATTGELEIPETSVHSGKIGSSPYSIRASGHLDSDQERYDIKTTTTIQDPFSLKGTNLSFETQSNYDNMLAYFGIRAETPLGKGTLSADIEGTPEGEGRAGIRYTRSLDDIFKKGGKVSSKKKKKKKKQSKKYAQGGGVRAAKY